MVNIELQPGDVFCVDGNMMLVSRLIRWAEIVVSQDNAAHYGHAGIITSSAGDTIEALWTVRRSTLAAYSGQRIIVARPLVSGSVEHGSGIICKHRALGAVAKHLGRWYPVWRLPLHLVPPLAKYLSTGRHLVCSELVAKYLTLIGARSGPYAGINPDALADMWIAWRNFEVLYEGVWP
jgi:hypothetical protein